MNGFMNFWWAQLLSVTIDVAVGLGTMETSFLPCCTSVDGDDLALLPKAAASGKSNSFGDFTMSRCSEMPDGGGRR